MPLIERGTYPAQRPVFTELHRYLGRSDRTKDLKAVILEHRKLILDRLAGTIELYDLKHDPGERRNIAADRPVDATTLLSILESFVDQGEREHPLP